MSKLIYVVDDEPNIREMMQLFLENAGYSVRTFEDGEAVRLAFSEQEPDMLILDIMMPGIDGLSLCTSIRQHSHVPIIIVSAKDTPLDRVTGITLGSDDYITKPFLPLELVARVKALFRRAAPNDDFSGNSAISSLSCGNLVIFPETHRIQVDQKDLAVTPREFDFLLYMIERKHTAVSKIELLEQIWHSADPEFDGNLVDDFIKRLRKKLRAAESTALIETVWGFGLRMSEKQKE